MTTPFRVLVKGSSPAIRLNLAHLIEQTPADSRRYYWVDVRTPDVLLDYGVMKAWKSETDSEVAKVWGQSILKRLKAPRKNIEKVRKKILELIEIGLLEASTLENFPEIRAEAAELFGATQQRISQQIAAHQSKRYPSVMNNLCLRSSTDEQKQAINEVAHIVHLGTQDSELGIARPLPENLNPYIPRKARGLEILKGAGFSEAQAMEIMYLPAR